MCRPAPSKEFVQALISLHNSEGKTNNIIDLQQSLPFFEKLRELGQVVTEYGY